MYTAVKSVNRITFTYTALNKDVFNISTLPNTITTLFIYIIYNWYVDLII